MPNQPLDNASWPKRLWSVFNGIFRRRRRAVAVLLENSSPFGEAFVTQRRTSIAINSAFGVSQLRQGTSTTGSASIDDTTQPGSILLKTGTTAGSLARLSTSEVGQYAPGFAAEIGLGIRPQGTLAGTAVARWGGRSVSGDDGFYFEESANDLVEVVRKKNGTVQDRKAQSEWNLDRLDGSGGNNNPSGIELSTIKGYIWQVDFTWYGYGLIIYGIIKATIDNPSMQYFVPVHYLSVDDAISIGDPNLQIFAELDNGDQTTDYTLEVGGMQYSVVGDSSGARKRVVDDYRDGVNNNVTTSDSDLTHLVSFRRKSSFLNRSVELRSLTNIVETELHIIEVWLGGTVTGGSWVTPTNYTASEVSIESNRTATAFDETGAVLVYRDTASAGQANKPGGPSNPVIDLDLPEGLTITMTARTLTGTGAVTFGLMRVEEGW